MAASEVEQRVQKLHEDAVKRLVEAHQDLEDPLLLAVRYNTDDALDLHILEVLEKFPGGDDDELFSAEYEPSASLRILGKLYLTLASPAQVRAALGRQDPLISRIKAGQLVFADRTKQDALRLLRELGFQS